MTTPYSRNDLALLPERTRSHLRSTQLITSLVSLVSELVQNSLDAGSRKVEVSVSVDNWACSVRDNGRGIARESLASVGSRYNSSKEYAASASDSQTFGFRGEALASIADICCLEITSHPLHQNGTATLITKGGNLLYSGEAVRDFYDRSTSGTFVYVRDVFYNLPVRRKSHPSSSRTYELIKKEIEAFALVFPTVDFLVTTQAESGETKSIVHVPPTGSTLKSFRRIFGRGLIQHTHEFNDDCPEYAGLRLDGFLSLDGALSKSHQFIYVNKHPVSYPQNNSELHKVVEDVYSRSSFARNAYDETEEPPPGTITTRKSPRKSGEKKPVFVLDLTVPQSHVDNGYEPGKSVVQFSQSNIIEKFISNKIESVLMRYGFMSALAPSQKRRASVTPSPTKRGTENPRKRLKISNAVPNNALVIRGDSIEGQQRAEDSNRLGSEYVTWTDSRTGRVYYVDPRTGNSVQPDENNENPEQGDAFTERRTLKLGAGRSLDLYDTAPTPAWITDALNANNVFRMQNEPNIPANPTEYDIEDHRHSFLKEHLVNASIINQVDRKFILCSIKDGTTLVVVDQHAADERVRVERFLTEYLNATASVRKVHPVLQMVVSTWEKERLRDSGGRQALASWGFDVHEKHDTGSNESTSDYEQIYIAGVPELLAEKLLQNKGVELRKFVRGFLGRDELMSHELSERSTWLDEARKCPPELVELINSKACRGAIMFNDTLTLQQCQKLINVSLPCTAFPFICAHGRPSIATVFELRPEQRRKTRRINWSTLMSL